jgi:hypothetical protein
VPSVTSRVSRALYIVGNSTWAYPAPRPQSAYPLSECLLVASEAALHLGITPELQFFYTSRSFQKRSVEKRRLPNFEVDGSTRFSASQLDAFDSYLREPRAEVGGARRDPPQRCLHICTLKVEGSPVEAGRAASPASARAEHVLRSTATPEVRLADRMKTAQFTLDSVTASSSPRLRSAPA